jgi:hypothetical protein
MIKTIPVSVGEFIDKITILEIKKERIKNSEQWANICHELDMLLALDDENIVGKDLYNQLKVINTQLWDVEENIRKREKQQDFGEDFVMAARSVYKMNDKRAKLKRIINLQYGSELVEEKSYEK